MAKDILDEMDDDLNDDPTEDISDDSVDEASDGIGEMKKGSSPKVFVKLKQGFRQILGSKKAILIIVGSLILFISLAEVWVLFFKSGPGNDQEVQNTIATGQESKTTIPRADEIVFEDIVELAPFERIQLKPGSTMKLISMNLSLELTDHRFRKQVYAMEDRIRKIITGQAEEMTWLELRNPEGKIMLKYNLLKRINSIFPKAMVRNIYFTYFIMQ